MGERSPGGFADEGSTVYTGVYGPWTVEPSDVRESGLMDNEAELNLLGVWMALSLSLVFAARKFQQPIMDDIGNKSVFMFNALPEEEEEKKVLARKLEHQKLSGA